MNKIFMMQIDGTESDDPKREIVPVVHYDGIGVDFTLCGVAYEEDDRYPSECATPTSKRVDCERCILIRNYVLGRI